jgi:hypothetical protein
VVLQSGWGNRTDRRVKNIEISTSVGENSPPAGKYLVEDKFGPNAFDEEQAQRYSSFLQNNGKVRTLDGKEYSGIIYFFDKQEAALKAWNKMQGLSANIYIGFYGESGNLQWLARRN